MLYHPVSKMLLIWALAWLVRDIFNGWQYARHTLPTMRTGDKLHRTTYGFYVGVQIFLLFVAAAVTHYIGW